MKEPGDDSMFERPLETIRAADVFHRNRSDIERACTEATKAEMVVALVSHTFVFEGVWIFPRAELVRRVSEVDDGHGWRLLFAAGSSLAHIDERCFRLARCSLRRWEALRSWSAGHE